MSRRWQIRDRNTPAPTGPRGRSARPCIARFSRSINQRRLDSQNKVLQRKRSGIAFARDNIVFRGDRAAVNAVNNPHPPLRLSQPDLALSPNRGVLAPVIFKDNPAQSDVASAAAGRCATAVVAAASPLWP